jgi:hypothetical protein
VTILHSINSEQPYSLFTELAEDENIFNVLQLFDYLGVNSFSLPLLKEKRLVLSNPTNDENEERIINYHRANLSEARNTAAEFIIAIYKNHYNLLDCYTVMNVFSLIMVIITKSDVFSSRFRHHTVTIVKEHCFQFFDTKQKREIIFTHNKIQKQRKLNSLKYFYDENGSLPEDFNSSFAWKGDHKLKDTHYTSWGLTSSVFGCRSRGKSYLLQRLFDIDMGREDPSTNVDEIRWITNSFIGNHLMDYAIKEVYTHQDIHKYKNNQAKSARAGYFNTLPKRTKVDKFKPRYGTKTQTYR